MKVVILAGGIGSRFSEETLAIPKPMIEVGGIPVLIHIMNIFSHYKYNDFIICCGYKGHLIKKYFIDYQLFNSNVSIEFSKNKILYEDKSNNNWKVSLVDTGLNTNTGGRLKKIKNYLKKNETFLMTYGDGLSNVNIPQLVNFHKKNKLLATMTVIQPRYQYGILSLKEDIVCKFEEKPKPKNQYVNGGFFVLSEKCLNLVKDDYTSWESVCIPELVKMKQLCAYKHDGFWHSMDTLNDKLKLEKLYRKNPPWSVFE